MYLLERCIRFYPRSHEAKTGVLWHNSSIVSNIRHPVWEAYQHMELSSVSLLVKPFYSPKSHFSWHISRNSSRCFYALDRLLVLATPKRYPESFIKSLISWSILSGWKHTARYFFLPNWNCSHKSVARLKVTSLFEVF